MWQRNNEFDWNVANLRALIQNLESRTQSASCQFVFSTLFLDWLHCTVAQVTQQNRGSVSQQESATLQRTSQHQRRCLATNEKHSDVISHKTWHTFVATDVSPYTWNSALQSLHGQTNFRFAPRSACRHLFLPQLHLKCNKINFTFRLATCSHFPHSSLELQHRRTHTHTQMWIVMQASCSKRSDCRGHTSDLFGSRTARDVTSS